MNNKKILSNILQLLVILLTNIYILTYKKFYIKTNSFFFFINHDEYYKFFCYLWVLSIISYDYLFWV